MEKDRCGTEEEWEGFRVGWKLLMEKYGAYSVLSKKSQPGSAWPGLAWSGPAQSAGHVDAPRGSRCVADGRMVCCEVPAIFLSPG